MKYIQSQSVCICKLSEAARCIYDLVIKFKNENYVSVMISIKFMMCVALPKTLQHLS